jgi:hypothetical protein
MIMPIQACAFCLSRVYLKVKVPNYGMLSQALAVCRFRYSIFAWRVCMDSHCGIVL